MREKLFAGPEVRALRKARRLTLGAFAGRIGISASYLSQIESNQRPLTAQVLAALNDAYDLRPESLRGGETHRLVADLREAIAESATPGDSVPLSEIRQAAQQTPALARRILELHRTNQRLTQRLGLTDEAVALDETTAASALLPYEEVREFFHDRDNYIDALDRAAEALAETLGMGREPFSVAAGEAYLQARLGQKLGWAAEPGLLRRFDPWSRTLTLGRNLPAETQAFQLAYHLAASELEPIIERELAGARFRTAEAVDICRIGLGNYAAGAMLMPYGRIAGLARRLRHDLEALALEFGVSLEQVCHRLSNLQRPDQRGAPVFFVRLDAAGNITKRHSATRLRFARFGGACPLWNVHEATTDRFDVQLAEMPDGARYLSVARGVVKPSGAYHQPIRRYVLGLGCEAAHAGEFVYADAVDLAGPAAPIGVSCRICERRDCAQRAFPPVDRAIHVPGRERRVVPFSLEPAKRD